MIATILAAILVFASGLAFGLALAVVTPEAGLCFLLMAFGSLDRWQRGKDRMRRWLRW